MTSSFPNDPLWDRLSRIGTSVDAIWSSRSSAPSIGGPSGEAPAAVPAAGAGQTRRVRAQPPPAPSSVIRTASVAPGRDCGATPDDVRVGRDSRVKVAEPLHPGEQPSLPVVESLLDVEREDVPSTGAPDPEGDRDRVVGLVADRHRDPLHAELLRPGGRAAVEADRRLAGRQPLDLDVAPADAAHPQPQHLRHGFLRRPSTGEGLRSKTDIALFRRRQDPARELLAEALDGRPDPVDLDDVDAELRDGRVEATQGGCRRDLRPRHRSDDYSTVTDLARFRGWSTSVPRATAT